MNIKQKLFEDLKSSMKAKNKIRVSTIRMLNSAIKNKEIESGKDLNNAEIEAQITSEVKKRRDSIELFKKGAREDLVKIEEGELEILLEYMPKQMDEEEIRSLARITIEESGASSAREIGMVMKAIMPKVKGKADGSAVSRIVKELLDG